MDWNWISIDFGKEEQLKKMLFESTRFGSLVEVWSELVRMFCVVRRGLSAYMQIRRMRAESSLETQSEFDSHEGEHQAHAEHHVPVRG